MKRHLLKTLIALCLTLPVYLCLAKNSRINLWFVDGRGWSAFQPLFDLCNAIGLYGNASILVVAMLVISFALALALVFASIWLAGAIGLRR